MWARALGWAAGWKCLLREFGPLHTLVRPQPLCGTGKRGHCLIFHEMGVIVMVLLLLVLVGSLLSFPPFLCFPSLPFCSFLPFYCFRVLPFPSLRSVPLTAIHSWHSIFCLPFPHLPFFPSLPFLFFHFLPVLAFLSRLFPCLSLALLPCLPFSPVPSSCSLLSERTHQMGYSTWNSLCATLPPVWIQVADNASVIPLLPPNLILGTCFLSEDP